MRPENATKGYLATLNDNHYYEQVFTVRIYEANKGWSTVGVAALPADASLVKLTVQTSLAPAASKMWARFVNGSGTMMNNASMVIPSTIQGFRSGAIAAAQVPQQVSLGTIKFQLKSSTTISAGMVVGRAIWKIPVAYGENQV